MGSTIFFLVMILLYININKTIRWLEKWKKVEKQGKKYDQVWLKPLKYWLDQNKRLKLDIWYLSRIIVDLLGQYVLHFQSYSGWRWLAHRELWFVCTPTFHVYLAQSVLIYMLDVFWYTLLFMIVDKFCYRKNSNTIFNSFLFFTGELYKFLTGCYFIFIFIIFFYCLVSFVLIVPCIIDRLHPTNVFHHPIYFLHIKSLLVMLKSCFSLYLVISILHYHKTPII